MSETLSVSELCEAVRATIDATFEREVWVKGAISGLTRSPGGHVYFDLIEPNGDIGGANDGVVPVALFASSRNRVNAILRKAGNIRMHDGVEIRIRGRVAYYPPQGRVQLVMSLIDPSYTVGQLAMARQVLLDKLSAEGLVAMNGALDWPALPLRVGLVTSENSAAHADFCHELEASGYLFDVTLFDARVQGIDAVASLVDAIDAASRSEDLDVVAVVRGGGAKTDLVAFDAERVARAIARCRLPIVVGVGHEVDRSVADELANTAAKTPTAAAAVLVDSVQRFDFEVETAAARLETMAAAGLANAEGSLVATAGRLQALTSSRLDGTGARLATANQRLAMAADRNIALHGSLIAGRAAELRHLGGRALERSEAAVDNAAVRLGALDPARALARGWSITHLDDGTLVREAATVPVGSTIVTTTGNGKLTSVVGGKRADSGDTDDND